MSTLPPDESFELLHNDAPESVVDYVLENLHEEDRAIEYTKPQWEEFTKDKPRLREYISRSAYEIAPDDIELRQRVTHALLGLYAVARESKIVEVLEEQFSDSNASQDAFIEAQSSTETTQEGRKSRIFGREKQPKIRGLKRSLAASALLLFGLNRTTNKQEFS